MTMKKIDLKILTEKYTIFIFEMLSVHSCSAHAVHYFSSCLVLCLLYPPLVPCKYEVNTFLRAFLMKLEAHEKVILGAAGTV
jgi:hypothetical protein